MNNILEYKKEFFLLIILYFLFSNTFSMFCIKLIFKFCISNSFKKNLNSEFSTKKITQLFAIFLKIRLLLEKLVGTDHETYSSC